MISSTTIASACCRISTRSGVIVPMMRTREPGPGERLAPHDLLGQPELLADRAHLVLEQVAQRLDELEVHVVGEAADVVVRLDDRVVGAARLDDVGVERALHEEPRVAADRVAASSNTRMNVSPMILRLRSGSMTSSSAPRNRSPAFTCTRSISNWRRNVSSTCSASSRRSRPGVDEHARELVADRLVHERGGDRGVDAAREPADHPLGADLRADLVDGLLDDRRRWSTWAGTRATS